MGDSTQGWTQGLFFQNQGTSFDFQKRAGEASPSPLVVCLPPSTENRPIQEAVKTHPEAVAQSCYVKKIFFTNFANFTGKHLCQSLFLNKLVCLSPPTLLKKDSTTGVFL